MHICTVDWQSLQQLRETISHKDHSLVPQLGPSGMHQCNCRLPPHRQFSDCTGHHFLISRDGNIVIHLAVNEATAIVLPRSLSILSRSSLWSHWTSSGKEPTHVPTQTHRSNIHNTLHHVVHTPTLSCDSKGHTHHLPWFPRHPSCTLPTFPPPA